MPDMLPGNGMICIPAIKLQIGEFTAIICPARVVTPRRFRNAKVPSACCGLYPSLKISDGKVTGTAIRGGNKPLHKVLATCANRLIYQHNEMFSMGL